MTTNISCLFWINVWKVQVQRLRSSESPSGAAVLWPCSSHSLLLRLGSRLEDFLFKWMNGDSLSVYLSLSSHKNALDRSFIGWVWIPTPDFVLHVFLSPVQRSEGNVTCSDKATLVAQPYYRLDLFNRKMRNVLFTAVLVTINGNHTLGHFGTSDGRILQVAIFQRMSVIM